MWTLMSQEVEQSFLSVGHMSPTEDPLTAESMFL